MARRAPASLRRWAMAQAMERLLATPKMTAFLPCMLNIDFLEGETGQDNRNDGRWGVGAPFKSAACLITAIPGILTMGGFGSVLILGDYYRASKFIGGREAFGCGDVACYVSTLRSLSRSEHRDTIG